MEDTALASELERLQAMARELGARVHDEGAPAPARELCGALAASVDRAVRLAAGSNGGNAGRGKSNGHPRNSCRKTAKVRRQVRVASVQDTGPLDDGLSWRKYGQKEILGARYPRAYFRCTHRHTRGCQATKQVQRATDDPLLFDVVYHAAHTCDQAPTAEPSLLLSPERQLPASGQEELGWPAATEAQTIRWPIEPVTPFSFPSSPAGAFDGCYLPASSGYGYAATHGFVVDDMEYQPQLDDFFFNPSELFQSEIQSL
uniref:Uncharacterized protein n=1 Tax=Avena sativa TaxID=4498 RepID=A0ACD5T737_AVESA